MSSIVGGAETDNLVLFEERAQTIMMHLIEILPHRVGRALEKETHH
jgi:hypothetical protein